MGKEGLVGLTTQSFRDAGGKEVYPDLEMDAPLLEVDVFNKESSGAFEDMKAKLREEAKKQGDTHVFKMEYTNERTFGGYNCKATGTGYKPRE